MGSKVTDRKIRERIRGPIDEALANIVEVVGRRAAHRKDLARVTIYVTDKKPYLKAIKEVGQSWQRHIGSHYPAMTLLQVSGLLEDKAQVEIEATAVLRPSRFPARPEPVERPGTP